MKHILFVCSANCNRSPTFEKVIRERLDSEKYEVRSAGIYYGYPYQVNEELLDWADIVFVMDLGHKMFLEREYVMFGRKIHVIGVSDEYDVMSEKLISIVNYWYDTEWSKYGEMLELF